MMTRLLLSGCGGGNEVEDLALAIRDELTAAQVLTAQASVTADYGQRVYGFELTMEAGPEETILTLTAPETVAGITARLRGEENTLEYDGLSVETGPLDEDGLTPVSALPALLEAAEGGYLTACTLEEDGSVLRVDCGDPEGTPGTGVETTLWFDAASHALTRGEITVDGFRAISCEFSDLTIG